MHPTLARRTPAGIRLDPDSMDLVIGERLDWSTCPGCARHIAPTHPGQVVVELETADGRTICHRCARLNAPGLYHASQLGHFVLTMRRRGLHDQARQSLLVLGDALELVDEHEAGLAGAHN